jgi:DNA-binding transcriptional MerR regulator
MTNEEKLFYTIGEASQMVDVKPYVLRYWESEFKKLTPQKSTTGQRTYRKKDIEIALTIKRLLYNEKYTIAGALQKLEELEKEGFDPIDLTVAKPVQPEAKSVSSVSLHLTPHKETSQSIESAYDKPIPSAKRQSEKVTELKSLIATTHSILKKYNLA